MCHSEGRIVAHCLESFGTASGELRHREVRGVSQ